MDWQAGVSRWYSGYFLVGEEFMYSQKLFFIISE
jgi:hypothetical protein